MPLGQEIIKKYRPEIYFIVVSFVILVFSVIMYIKGNTEQYQDPSIVFSNGFDRTDSEHTILVDISGSVLSPDVYEISSGARLRDILVKAGGLSAEADRTFFARNFNLAQELKDQEKIYIPSTSEIENGESSGKVKGIYTDIHTSGKQISLNSSTIEQLDTLPGIGKTTAQKIIDNRPYKSIEELIQKKVVYKSTFADIREMISL